MLADLLMNQSLYLIGLIIFISLLIATEVGQQFGRRLTRGGSVPEKRECWRSRAVGRGNSKQVTSEMCRVASDE